MPWKKTPYHEYNFFFTVVCSNMSVVLKTTLVIVQRESGSSFKLPHANGCHSVLGSASTLYPLLHRIYPSLNTIRPWVVFFPIASIIIPSRSIDELSEPAPHGLPCPSAPCFLLASIQHSLVRSCNNLISLVATHVCFYSFTMLNRHILSQNQSISKVIGLSVDLMTSSQVHPEYLHEEKTLERPGRNNPSIELKIVRWLLAHYKIHWFSINDSSYNEFLLSS